MTNIGDKTHNTSSISAKKISKETGRFKLKETEVSYLTDFLKGIIKNDYSLDDLRDNYMCEQMEQVANDKAKEIAINLNNEGVDISIIAKSANVAVETVKEWLADKK